MLLYRLAFYPNGALDAARLDLDELEPDTLATFEPLFAGGPSFTAAMPGAPDVSVKWTGSDVGQALLSASHSGQLFLSGVLVAGLDVDGDSETLRMFAESLEAAPLLRQIIGDRPDPFVALLERPERPLLAAVIWPTLPAEAFEELAGLDILLSAAFLRRIGG